MSQDVDAAVVQRFMDDVLGTGKTPTLEDVDHVAGLDAFLRPFQQGFPDLRLIVQNAVASGGTVTVQATGCATHAGPFEGIPPSGKTLTFSAAIVFRVEDRRIVEARVETAGGDIWHQLHNLAESEQPWYKQYAGGMWEKEGQRQLTFLKDQGLLPHHFLLDIGCGTLKGGVKLIPYLDRGHYYGIDASPEAMRGAREALDEMGLEAREPHLVQMGDFNFSVLGPRFEYAIAKSLFTEIPLNGIIRCIMSVERVLVPGGRLYATFWENEKGKFNLEPVYHGATKTYFDSYPYHYDFGTFEWICDSTTLRPSYLGPWASGAPQKLMVFVKEH